MSRTQSSEDCLVPQSQTSLPTTPTPTHAQLPDAAGLKASQQSQPSLTPPPSSQPKRTAINTPEPTSTLLSSPPPSTVKHVRGAHRGEVGDMKITEDQIKGMQAEELRDMVKRLMTAVHDAKTTAAHYKLQHQMSQMESGKAVERMAVEMEMARREIEVMQQAEAHQWLKEDKAVVLQPDSDPNFRQVHNDVYANMTDEIKDLKIRNVQLERELEYSRKVLEQQESEIASLNDKVLLMRDRIRESRDQLMRYRRAAIDTTPRTNRTTPNQTPVRERFTHLDPSQHQQQQPGFAALLQATDIVSQGGCTPSGDQRKGHSRGIHSLSSLPATPQRSNKYTPRQKLYTPQPPRQAQMPLEVPMTAPVARKRPVGTLTPPRPTNKRGYESDGTVSAADDSEAETEVAEGDIGDSRASHLASDMLRTPTAKRAKSAHNLKGMTQTKLFGQVTKSSVPRSEHDRQPKRAAGADDDVGLGIAGMRERQTQESPA
ncbi:hypothetical protein C1H76_1455 [Elsinoe australis]|uniref:Uncharacterized protein n=1 Tax=Elsinoe australis TaxID=40998 RepID=A0A4U7B9E4_9PEZI|nr:hypothetical protein C1H76_1455 [Elsinoe australis]